MKVELSTLLGIFLITLEVQGHTVSYWKDLRSDKCETRRLGYDSTLNISQGVLKSGNLLDKQCCVQT